MSNRKFVRQGKVSVNGNNKTHIFVFSDIILLTTPQKLKGKGKSDKKAKGADGGASDKKKVEYKFRADVPLKNAKLAIPAVAPGKFYQEYSSPLLLICLLIWID